MSLSKDDVKKVAHLARIHVAEDRLDGLAGELNQIIGWVEQLSEVDTDGVEPMTSAIAHDLRWREDAVTDGAQPDKVLANGPATELGFYVVPKVVE
ncbi:MAG: Asp-tRNA(Asn)/Glu-tRNA(Gln) amidotransferase subunit GatC [Alphaproteobacteria bacterium]|nr:Asp-tRNA(Asn)/Glu-tRNA(Gln) amidotransferase subunit GatC [Alphaproteobacteria bacterium]